MQLSVGDVFKSKNEVQNAIRMYAVDNNFNFETTDSTPKKYTIQCKERRTHGCDAVITAALRKKDNMFVVKKLKNMHNCPQQASCMVQSSGRYIADEIKEMPDVEQTRIGQIMNKISARRGIKIGYSAAWRAKKEALGEEVNEEHAQEECLKSIVAENMHINPYDIERVCNMKEMIEVWKEDGYTVKERQGYICRVVRALGALDTAGTQLDTLFYASSLSLHVYKHSRQIVELYCHKRSSEGKESVGYMYIAVGYDAFDMPYILAMCIVPEYCGAKEGWIYFVKELMRVIEQGVLLIEWEGSHETVGELEKEIQKKNKREAYSEEEAWRGHYDIEEAMKLGELENKEKEKLRFSLFVSTRSLCKEIFSTHPCFTSIGLVWSLCNSPDLATFQMYYKKVKAQNVPSLLSLLSSLPTHFWAKYLSVHPLYNKNNVMRAEIEGVHGIVCLPPVDALCMCVKVIHDNAAKKREIVMHAEQVARKTADKARFGECTVREMETNIAKAQQYEVDVGRTPDTMCKSSWIDPRKLNDEEEHAQGIVYSGSLRFYVDLWLRVCSCMKFQEMSYPCSHACALITKIGGQPYAYIDDMYTVETLAQMYKPVSIRCIVNEPIRGAEERRRQTVHERPRKTTEYDTDEFACGEQKENIAAR